MLSEESSPKGSVAGFTPHAEFPPPASGLIPHWIAAWSYSTWSPPLETSINFTLRPLPRLEVNRQARPRPGASLSRPPPASRTTTTP